MKYLYEAVFWLVSVLLWLLTFILLLPERCQAFVKKLARRTHAE